jgi:hypothetical protein
MATIENIAGRRPGKRAAALAALATVAVALAIVQAAPASRTAGVIAGLVPTFGAETEFQIAAASCNGMAGADRAIAFQRYMVNPHGWNFLTEAKLLAAAEAGREAGGGPRMVRLCVLTATWLNFHARGLSTAAVEAQEFEELRSKTPSLFR